jgi:ATP-dependent Clp protease protease subunit
MAQEQKNPVFSERVREQLLRQRVLVLDGVLDDDNGTLLATQLLALAAEDPGAGIALWINSPGSSCSRPARRAGGSRCRTPGS